MDDAILTNAKEIGDLKWQEYLLHDMKTKQCMDRIMRQKLQDMQKNCEDRRRRLLLGNSEDELQNTQESLLAAVSREHDQIASYINKFAQILSSFRHLNVPKAAELNEVMVKIKNKSFQFLETVESGGTVELEKVHQCTGQAKKVLVLLVQQVEQAKIKAAEDEKRRKEDEQELKRFEKRKQEEAKRIQRKEEEEAELRKKKQEEEEEKRAKATREESATMRQSLQEDAVQQPVSPSSNPVDVGKQVHVVSASRSRREMADGNLEMYSALQNLRKKFEEQSSTLISDSKSSQYRFKLQKAVMAPLNTLGAVTGSQLQRKLNSLLALLGGETVEVVGGRVSIREHPSAATFTQFYLAKQLVGKSESLASQRDVLFGLASLAVAIWCRNKDIGRLILSFLYLNCPYLALIRLTKGDKSEEEFFKSLGYIIEDGNVEHESKFLDRMAGYVSLYAAIIISSPPSTSGPHPHGLEHAWKWLSSVMNSEPLPGITATLIFNFLDICGRRLMTTYGRQFWKLVELLNASFLPKVRTCGGDGGPISRLEDFLSQALKTRNIREPHGFLGPNVWNVR